MQANGSVRLWCGTGRTVVRSDEYTAWIKQADAVTMASAQLRGVQPAAKPTVAHDAKWGPFVIDPDFFTKLVYEGV
jgi:hypothetical protein